MAVLLTGAAGFIGSNLAIELEKRGQDVIALDNLSSGTLKNLKDFQGHIIEENVASSRCVSKLSGAKIDTIFHLASITDTTITDEKIMNSNVEGFRQVLEYSKNNECTVVWASSAAIYGNGPVPMKEDQPPDPRNAYAESKLAMEKLASQYQNSVKVIGIRYFNVYGPRESHKGSASSMIYRLICSMLKRRRPRIFKWGKQRRDFIYIKDAVEITLMAQKLPSGTIINAATGIPVSFNLIIKTINQVLGTDLMPDYFDNPYNEFYQDFTQADTTRLHELTGYKAKHDISKGIAEYIEYIKDTLKSSDIAV